MTKECGILTAAVEAELVGAVGLEAGDGCRCSEAEGVVAEERSAEGVVEDKCGVVVSEWGPADCHRRVGNHRWVDLRWEAVAEPQVVDVGDAVAVVRVAERDVASGAVVGGEVDGHVAVVISGPDCIDGGERGCVVGEGHHAHFEHRSRGIVGVRATDVEGEDEVGEVLFGSRHSDKVAALLVGAELEGALVRGVESAVVVSPDEGPSVLRL